MKLRLLIAISICSSFCARSQNLEWAEMCPTTNLAQIYAMTIDAAGNIYTTGYFQGITDFDPGIGSYNMTSPGENVFIQKLDKHGNFLWAKQFGGSGSSIARGIVADSFGHIYLTGQFDHTLDFDGGPGIDSMTGLYGGDIFIEKMDTAGNFIYAKRIGSSGSDETEAITTDRYGNVYFAGSFSSTVDFDPGPGVYNVTSLSSSAFVAELDSAGNFVMAKNLANGGGTGSGSIAWSLAIDAAGNILTTGTFNTATDFDPGPGTFTMTPFSTGNPNTFISKLDNAGNLVWAKQIGGNGACYGFAVVADDSGNVFASGNFDYTIDLDPGTGTFSLTSTSAGYWNSYLLKLNSSGNFVWGKQLASVDDIQAVALALDRAGNVFSTGFFRNTVDFDPGPGTYYMSALLGTSVNNYLLVLANNGNFISAQEIAGSTSIQADVLMIDKKRNVYLGGIFTGTYDFDPGTGVYNLATGGSENMFVQKLNYTAYANDTTTICGSYTLGGHTYTSSGVYHDTVTAVSGMDSIVSLVLTINPMPVAGTVTGPDTVCLGGTITLTDPISGGVWVTVNTSAAVAAGVVSGMTYGTDTVIYMVSNDCGTDSSLHPLVVVNCRVGVAGIALEQEGLTIWPNPGNGVFNITLITAASGQVPATITDMLGKTIKAFSITTNKENAVDLALAAGVYLLSTNADGVTYARKIVVTN